MRPRAAPSWPTADAVAEAIVAACRLNDVNPQDFYLKSCGRERAIVAGALCAAYPLAPKNGLARICGYQGASSLSASQVYWRKRPGWRDDWIDEVTGLLVADDYGERAA